MGDCIKLRSSSKTWIVMIDKIKDIGLLNSIYDDTKADVIEVRKTFEYVYMFMEGSLSYVNDADYTNDAKLISLLKYADFLDYKKMMDYLGKQLAKRLENMSDKELCAFQHKFATIE